MLHLLSLPYEVLSYIVENIDFDDVVSLGYSCNALKYLLHEDHICKKILESKIPFSDEALEARLLDGDNQLNARSLRRAAKRRLALATASPFVVAMVGRCNAYLYSRGILSYIKDDKIRILDLGASGINAQETVIHIPGLVSEALAFSDIGASGRDYGSSGIQGTFQLLYYSDGILSCIYRSFSALESEETAYLIAFHISNSAILFTHELPSTEKLFIRNNANYLYYGTHSGFGSDGYRKWVLQGYSFLSGCFFENKIYLNDFIGHEMNERVVFELMNGYFYAVSSQGDGDDESDDDSEGGGNGNDWDRQRGRNRGWESFYKVYRWPEGESCRCGVEKRGFWRRGHEEGPIDDRWSGMSLCVDERGGGVRVVEGRREWLGGGSRSGRSFYSTELKFPSDSENNRREKERSHRDEEQEEGVDNGDSSQGNETEEPASSSYVDPEDRIMGVRSKQQSNLPYRTRKPQFVHRVDDGSTRPTFTLSKSLLRTYHSGLNTFLDLVDDPGKNAAYGKKRIRLRAGSRRLNSPLDDEGNSRKQNSNLEIALREEFQEGEITLWPPPLTDNEERDKQVEELYKILNPAGFDGEVVATGDGRNVVYSVGGGDGGLKALVFLGFDAGVRLDGLQQWSGVKFGGMGKEIFIGEDYRGDRKGKQKESERTVIVERKGEVESEWGSSESEKKTMVPVSLGGVGDGCSASDSCLGVAAMFEAQACGVKWWVWRETAMHRDINLGFYLGLDKLREKK